MAVATDNICVFILAENRLLREALTRLLSKKSDIRGGGASAFSPQVVTQISAAAPAVPLSASTAGAPSDLQLIAGVRGAVPGLKVVMIGVEAEREPFVRAIHGGVVGYVLKGASAMEGAAAVRSVAGDEAVCPPTLCLSLFQHVATQRAQTPSFHIKHSLGLTRREQQLVQMISRGLTNKEIASQLNLSAQPVKNHIHRILRQ